MAREATTLGGSVVVQGFVAGGGVPIPYVWGAILDAEGVHEFSLTPEQANTLAEYIRQEAEAASGPQNEVPE